MAHTKLAHLFHLNCQDAHEVYLYVHPAVGSLAYGWANGPSGRAQHVWIVSESGVILDLFGWTDHEFLGFRASNRERAKETVQYLQQNYTQSEITSTF